MLPSFKFDAYPPLPLPCSGADEYEGDHGGESIAPLPSGELGGKMSACLLPSYGPSSEMDLTTPRSVSVFET